MWLSLLLELTMASIPAPDSFAARLLAWFDQHGRHDLPWQVNNDPYKVWVSEVMLQQTQVKTVLQYFDRFMTRFPTVQDLGRADWDEVAPYWAGLGYYARARNLHKAAGVVTAVGQFPDTLAGWTALSGIGPSTAGALMSLGLRKFGVIMDGNVKRVLTRWQAIEGDSAKPAVTKPLWQLAERLTPQQRNADYTQAIMDLGATICTPKKPLCLYCPLQHDCQALAQGRVLEFPQKSTRKATPVRSARVLILPAHHTGHGSDTPNWLWLQRPAEGLWGGLWCLPIIESDAMWTLLQHRYGSLLKYSAQIRHTFTHFTWELQAVQLTVDASHAESLLMELAPDTHSPTLRWMSADHAIASGIPQAMHKLLEATNAAQIG
jgi:A/G-specific adenine glycosylase